MHRSKTEIYLHLVWATYRRLPLILPEIEAPVHGLIAGEARRVGCDVLAVGGMPDHVHLALRLPPALAVAKLMQQMKVFRPLACGRSWAAIKPSAGRITTLHSASAAHTAIG
jgi:REP element-mobilizing transposase RayT